MLKKCDKINFDLFKKKLFFNKLSNLVTEGLGSSVLHRSHPLLVS